MASVSIGDIVFVRFPFSDLSQAKKRPALVLAGVQKGDLILCQITSQPYAAIKAIPLRKSSFIAGHLIKTSYVRPEKFLQPMTVLLKKKSCSGQF